MARHSVDIHTLVQGINDRNKIKLRLRKRKDHYNLFMDYSGLGPDGQSFRIKRVLQGLTVFGDKKRLAQDQETLKLAEAFIQQQARILFSAETGLPMVDNNKRTDFLDYANRIYQERRQKAKREGKRVDTNYRIGIDKLRAFLKNPERLPMYQLTPKLCKEFSEHLTQLSISPNTANHYFTAFKTILNHAVKDGLLPQNPATGLRIKFPEPRKEYLTNEELKKLFNTPMRFPHIRNAFLFSCYTGLRKGDILKLTLADVKDESVQISQGKTGRIVNVPISDTARQILQRHLEETGQSDADEKDRPIFRLPSNSRLGKRLQAWVNDAGIDKKVTFHCARHTFGTLLVKARVDIYRVMTLMGNRDVRTTQIYAKLAEEDLRKAVEKLPGLEEEDVQSED